MSYAGGSWAAVSYLIPAGTVMLFYQATAPTGWSEIDTPITDYFINATSVAAADGGSETSTFNNVGAESSHTHNLSDSGWCEVDIVGSELRVRSVVADPTFSGTHKITTSGSSASGTSGNNAGWTLDGATDAGSSHAHSHVQADHAYANVIICDKDAY